MTRLAIVPTSALARAALRPTLILALILALILLLPAAAGRAQPVLAIADDAALEAALARGVGGAVLELAPGDYGRLDLRNRPAPAAIRSADPGDPARLAGLRVSDFDGLTVENLVLDYTYHRNHDIWHRPFEFTDGRNLTLSGLTVDGDVARDRDEFSDGLGFAVGLRLQNVSGATLTGSRISLFYRGLVVSGASDVRIAGNEFVDLRMDGMNFSDVRRVWIENNLVHGFDRSTDRRDHADMIQFWTRNTRGQTRDIVIRGNILNSGDGDPTQAIFMRNELVDQGEAGIEMFYRNILIEENVILNAHFHGITVGETQGLTIRNNTVVQNLASAGNRPNRNIRIPHINLSEGSRDVTVTGNIVADILGRRQPDWRIADNLLVQNQSLGASNHYAVVFDPWPQGDYGAVETYFYASDGPAAQGHYGARRLVPR